MMPAEVGAAAAYEAYRQIKYSTNAYSFLYDDYDRQAEALRGMAVAEGVSLSITALRFTTHISRDPISLHKPSVCGRTRVVPSTSMAFKPRATLPLRQPII
jgi:hypothetical protein